MPRRTLHLATLLLAAWAIGCSADDVAHAAADHDDAATDASQVDGAPTDASASTDATLVDSGPTLCAQLGGFSALKSVVDDIAGTVTTDCRVDAFFDPAKGGRNTYGGPHILSCLEKYFGAAAGCVDATGAAIRYDHDDATPPISCRDMTASHAGLGLSDADFAAFLEDVAKVLDAHAVAPAARSTIIDAVQATLVQIVEAPAAGNSKSVCVSVAPDAGSPSGSDAASGAPEVGADAGSDAPTDADGG
jgi:hypothetical protein